MLPESDVSGESKELPTRLVRKEWEISTGMLHNRGAEDYSYDENGRMTSITGWEHGSWGINNKWMIELDEHGNSIKEMSGDYEYDDYTTVNFDNRYDQEGRLVRVIKKDEKGKIKEKRTYEYDERGNKTREIWQGGIRKKATTSTWKWEYDERGFLIKETNPLGFLEHEYDEHGLCTRTRNIDSEGRLVAVAEFSYDEQGRKIKRTVPDWDGPREITEYEYDDKGNLILERSSLIPSGLQDIRKYKYIYE